ncbi:MAG: tetratricopeptide repeat protein [Bacteroidota bacterium]
MASKRSHIQQWLPLGVILLLTLGIFAPSLNHDFVKWDDTDVVLNNPVIHKGLSAEMFTEAFSTPSVAGQYYPVTLVSFAFNYSLGEFEPASYHALNLVLHLLNVGLVFVVLGRLKLARWLTAWIALLFAIHPLHVEPVAWIASRKDVLYLFFMLGAWWSYLEYRAGGSRKRLFYASALILMLLSVLSKSAAIVFPFVLLLTDYFQERVGRRAALREKIPFLLVSLVFVGIGIAAQDASGAIASTGELGLVERFVYGGFALATYLGKALVPFDLAAYHPYPVTAEGGTPSYVYLVGILIWLGVAVALWLGRRHRHFLFGAGLFLLGIFPFLQFVPVGASLTAERFTYFPYLGLFFLMGLGLQALRRKLPTFMQRELPWQLGLLVLALPWSGFAWAQVGTWENGGTLWSQVLKVYPESGEALTNRADYYRSQGLYKRALADYETSIRVAPEFYGAFLNRGMMNLDAGNFEAALVDFNRVLALDTSLTEGYLNRGLVFMRTNRHDLAVADFDRAIAQDTAEYRAHYNRGFIRGIQGNFSAAVVDFDRAIALRPDIPVMYKDRAMAHQLLKNFNAAVRDYSRAIELDPGYGEAWEGRAVALLRDGQPKRARADARQAQQLGRQLPGFLVEQLGL